MTSAEDQYHYQMMERQLLLAPTKMMVMVAILAIQEFTAGMAQLGVN